MKERLERCSQLGCSCCSPRILQHVLQVAKRRESSWSWHRYNRYTHFIIGGKNSDFAILSAYVFCVEYITHNTGHRYRYSKLCMHITFLTCSACFRRSLRNRRSQALHRACFLTDTFHCVLVEFLLHIKGAFRFEYFTPVVFREGERASPRCAPVVAITSVPE